MAKMVNEEYSARTCRALRDLARESGMIVEVECKGSGGARSYYLKSLNTRQFDPPLMIGKSYKQSALWIEYLAERKTKQKQIPY